MQAMGSFFLYMQNIVYISKKNTRYCKKPLVKNIKNYYNVVYKEKLRITER